MQVRPLFIPTESGDTTSTRTVATSFGRSLLMAADAAAHRVALGVVHTSRALATGTGLTGGGDLSSDRTISIAGYTGLVAQDYDPGSQSYGANSTTTVRTISVGASALWLGGCTVPAPVTTGINTILAVTLSDNSVVEIQRVTTGALVAVNAQTCNDRIYGNATVQQAARNNGLYVKNIMFQVANTTGSPITVDVGSFYVRAHAYPVGGGSITVV